MDKSFAIRLMVVLVALSSIPESVCRRDHAEFQRIPAKRGNDFEKDQLEHLQDNMRQHASLVKPLVNSFQRLLKMVDWLKTKASLKPVKPVTPVKPTVKPVKPCGVRPHQSRVVNGVNAQPHSWPWQISLRVNGRHICGGSLIDKDWVLTAAHCVRNNPNPSGYTVVVGAHKRLGVTAVQKTFRVRKLYKHEGFSMSHLRNDIALLQLQGSISASSKVNIVCLPRAGSRAPAGARCSITGWGRTVGGGSAADVLQQATLTVASFQACSRINNRLKPVDDKSMICAGGRSGAGGCQGDSGGPLVCNENGKWVLRGAVSWGHKLCRTDYYTVFARISNFIAWINTKKENGSKHLP